MAKTKSNNVPFTSTQLVGSLAAIVGIVAFSAESYLAAIALLLAGGLLVLPTEGTGPNAALFRGMRTVGILTLGFYAVYILIGFLSSSVGSGY